MKVASLFSGGGIGESRLSEIGCESVLSNEIIESRCNLYSQINSEAEMIFGDITENRIQKDFIKIARDQNVDVIMATPPCQGMSVAGNMDKNDPRNHLIKYAIDIILDLLPKYVLLENVPRQLQTYISYNQKNILIPDYIKTRLSKKYNFSQNNIVKAMDYGVPQMRKRNILLCSRKDQDVVWELPEPEDHIVNLKEAIGHYPSIDPRVKEGMQETLKLFPDFEQKRLIGEKFSRWHTPPTHSLKHIISMQKTPSGKTAFDNEIFFPKKNDGKRVSGHYNHYRRLEWNKPSRSLTQNNGVISSLACVHPGRIIQDGNEESRIYSDPRCFTIKEIFTIMSTNFDQRISVNTPHTLIRKVIGEGVPPLLINKIFQNIV